MKYLIATKETQGRRKNDFIWADEGEFVRFGSECDGGFVDGHCGCRRSMRGVNSGKGTTTMKVVEIDDKVKKEIINKTASEFADHWGVPKGKAKRMANEDVEHIMNVLEEIPVGVIMEKRGDEFQSRGRS